MSESDDSARLFTAGIERRFRWHRSLLRRPRPSIGALALRSVRQARVVGRPLSLRSAVGAPSPIGAHWAGRSVRPLGHPFLRLWRLSQVSATEPPDLVAAIAAHAGRLPRATARQQTPFAPGGGLTRLQREVLPVRLVPDVAAVGSVVSDRERRRSRTVPRPPASHGRYRVPVVSVGESAAPEERLQEGSEAPDSVTTATGQQARGEPPTEVSHEHAPTPSPRNRAQERPRRRRGDRGAPAEPDPSVAPSRDGVAQSEVPVVRSGPPGGGTDADPEDQFDREERGGIVDEWGASPADDPAPSSGGWGAVALLVQGLDQQGGYVGLARRGSELVGERGPYWQYTTTYPRTTFRRSRQRDRDAPPARPLRRVRMRTRWLRSADDSPGVPDRSEGPGFGAVTQRANRRAGGARGSQPAEARVSGLDLLRRLVPGGRVASAGPEGDGSAHGTRRMASRTRGRRVGRRDRSIVEPGWGSTTNRPEASADESPESAGDVATRRQDTSWVLGAWPTVIPRGRNRTVLDRGIDALPAARAGRGLPGAGVVPLVLGDVSLYADPMPWSLLAGPMGSRLLGRPRPGGWHRTSLDSRAYVVGSGRVAGGFGGRWSLAAEKAGQPSREQRQRDPGEAVRPLPASLEPLASALGVRGPVEVQSGPLTRQSLRAVGTVAATVGRRILVERPVDRSPEALGVIAHELVHVAAGDTTRGPRLFDDPRLDDEERRARRVGTLVRALVGDDRGIEGDRTGALTAMPPPPRGLRMPDSELHGSGALQPATPPPAVPGAPSDVHDGVLADLQALYARSVTSTTTGDRAMVVPSAPLVPGVPVPEDQGRDRFGQGVDGGGGRVIDDTGAVRPSSAPRAEEFLDWLVEQVERRLVRELDTRGLRHRPDVL